MTELVGIVNLTPDSFSGDGLMAPDEAQRRIGTMIEQGASVIDIGAESTRPGAKTLSVEEEWSRIAPLAQVIAALSAKARFSVDTRHALTARKAVKAGFRWINDVSGGADEEMFVLAKETGATLVLMHSLAVPANPRQTLSADADPVAEVLAWAGNCLKAAARRGVERTSLILDPGIGFGKTAAQSFALIKGIARLKELAVPVLVGHSRKSFLSLFSDKEASERDPETVAVSWYLAAQGVDYLRVHDIKSHAAMLRLREAL